MIKTLEQQQEKRSTPNIEPHAGGTESTPTTSPSVEIDTNKNTFQLRSNKSNSNSKPELEQETELKYVLEKHTSTKLENGRASKKIDEFKHFQGILSKRRSAILHRHRREGGKKCSAAVAIEDPSTLFNDQKFPIEDNRLIDNNEDDDSSSQGKEAFPADESSERPTTSSSAMEIRKKRRFKYLFDNIKEENKSPPTVIESDAADEHSASIKEASPADNTKNGEASPAKMQINEESSHNSSERIPIEEKSRLSSSSSSAEETSSSTVIKTNEDNSQDDQSNDEEETLSPVPRVGDESLSQDEENESLPLRRERPISLSSSSSSSSSSSVLNISEDPEDIVDSRHRNNSESSSSPAQNNSLEKSESTSLEANNQEKELESDQEKLSETSSSPVYAIDEDTVPEKAKESKRTSPVDSPQGNESDSSSSSVYAIDDEPLAEKKIKRKSPDKSLDGKISERKAKQSKRTSPVDSPQGNESDSSSSSVYAIDDEPEKEIERTSPVKSLDGKLSERSSSPDDNISEKAKESKRTSPVDSLQGNESERSSSSVYAIDDELSEKESKSTSPVKSLDGKLTKRKAKHGKRTSPVDSLQGTDSDRSSSSVYAIDNEPLSEKESKSTSPVESLKEKLTESSSSPVYAIDDNISDKAKESKRTSPVDSPQGNDSERSSSVYAIDDKSLSEKELKRTSPVQSLKGKLTERKAKESKRTSPVDSPQGNDSERSSSSVYAIDNDPEKEVERTSPVKSLDGKLTESSSSPVKSKESERTPNVDSPQGNNSESSSPSIDKDKLSEKNSHQASPAKSLQGKLSKRLSPPVCHIDEDKIPAEKNVCERTSPVKSLQGNDLERSSTSVNAIDENKFCEKKNEQTSPVKSLLGKHSERSSSSLAYAIDESKVSAKKEISEECLPGNDSERSSSLAYAIDEDKLSEKESEQTSASASKSPATIPAEEEISLDSSNSMQIDDESSKLPTISTAVIKIESDAEEQDMQVEQQHQIDHIKTESSKKKKPKKLNGIHTTLEHELRKLDDKQEDLSNMTVKAQNVLNQQRERRSSRSSSSTISSTSEHLVIDVEHKSKQQRQHHKKDKQLLLALKRRRSNSNSNSNDPTTSKKLCLEQEQSQQQSSLLLQRLQAPAPNTHEMARTLSCYRCNGQSFENFQQLNAHHEVCNATTTATAPTLTPAAVAPPNPKRLYRCLFCKSVHQSWHFFIHMRNVHKRFCCLYCSHLFVSVEKLSLHLENKHDMDQRHFAKVEDWKTLQAKEDRPRHLICCTCQEVFELGDQFEDHDCAEFMQPCALCGQKGSHANGCKNGNISNMDNSNRKKTATAAAKRKRRPAAKSKQMEATKTPQQQLLELPQELPQQQQQQLQQPPTPMLEMNIPAPVEDAPRQEEEPPMPPRLVVPKIMLRVPKQFQKSVDAALSSTDTEDDEIDETATTTAAAAESASSLLTVDAVQQQQQQHQHQEPLEPLSSQSDDTETATETASVNVLRDNVMDVDDEHSKSSKLDHVLAELERTKLDIARTMAELSSKRQQRKEQQQQLQQHEEAEQPPLESLPQQQYMEHEQAQQQLLQQMQQQQAQILPEKEEQQQLLPATDAKQERRRWSLTPPASPPHNNNNHINEETHVPREEEQLQVKAAATAASANLQRRATMFSECMDLDDSINVEQDSVEEQQQQPQPEVIPVAPPPPPATPPPPPPPADGIIVAGEDTHTVDLQLDRPLDKFEMVEFVRLCLKTVYPYCLYCNHARRIAVNAQQLVLHLISMHRFTATVDSITAEELHAETIVLRLKSFLPAFDGGHYMNAESCCSLDGGRFSLPFNERLYECFQCRYVTASHKELYTHNRRLHIKANITCSMCRLHFFSFSELLCHICPGVATCNPFDLQFRCCLCETAPLPSAFRLMVHLRKQHQACDICLEDCHSQAKLSSHVWKHKLLHLCYRCGISYRNKQDISKHLFWKHGTESASCKRCLQKRWRHVYHFCIPAAQFSCEHCLFTCSKAIYLEVHRRQHLGDFRYACNEEDCEEKFVSRKLLLKHAAQHIVEIMPPPTEEITKQEEKPVDTALELTDEQALQLKTEILSPKLEEDEVDAKAATVEDKPATKSLEQPTETPRKRRKKNKRNKASLEDLNLIAPNLSESDSSDDSDSDAARSIGTQQDNQTLPMRASVDDLDMPRVMLSPSSESDSEEQTKEDKEQEQSKASVEAEPKEDLKPSADEEQEAEKDKPKLEEDEEEEEKELEAQEMPDIWKNLLQHQPIATEPPPVVVVAEPTEEQLRPAKLHVAISDHDYCKMQRTPPPTPPPSPKKTSPLKPVKTKRRTASDSDSDSSSSSSSSDSDSSSCSCGSNCSCSSSGSSSSDDDSDNETPTQKKSIQNLPESNNNNSGEDYVNVTAVSEVEPRPVTPTPQAPLYNESDYDTNVPDTDEEFYDAHPQKMAREMAEKRLAENSAQHNPGASSNNYLIVENSRPSTPSLPEEAAAFADKRERVSKNKKRKRERKSTCKSTNQLKVTPPMMLQQQQQHLPVVASTPLPLPLPLPLLHEQLQQIQQLQQLQQQLQQQQQQHQQQQQQHHLQLLPESPMTPTTTHRLPNYQPRMSEGSSCSDADGQLKRSKRTRRPNKFYGYTSDDENMSSVLAPPLQVGLQLIKPQPPPQLTWAKEDLPTPPKQHRNRNNNHHTEQLSSASTPHNNSHHHSNGSNGRKRTKRTLLSGGVGAGGSGRRAAKRIKQSPLTVVKEPKATAFPPIPTLKIRPALLPVASADPSDTSDSSSDDEDAEINVTSLVPPQAIAQPPVVIPAPVVAPPAPLPPPATTAFNTPIPPALLPNPNFETLQYFKANNIRYPIRPPAGARQAREGESVYCYCRCPYDEVSEMIACDGQKCIIEWFHFECVGIMVAPQGKWYCAECRPKYSEELYTGQMQAM